MALPSVVSQALPRLKLPKAVLTPPRRLTDTRRVARTLFATFALDLYARVTHCVMLHPRHADVAPARALAAPCKA